MSTNESIYKQHEENQDWTSKLAFYADEIKILRGRLEEIASKNSSKDVLALVEHFQNQFIIQQNNIDELKHDIKMNEQALVDEINRNPVAVDHRKVAYHEKEQQLIASFEKVFNEMRGEYNAFSAKWM